MRDSSTFPPPVEYTIGSPSANEFAPIISLSVEKSTSPPVADEFGINVT